MERTLPIDESQYRAVRSGPRDAADWENAALDAIAASGVRAVTIPALAETLGVTKGSFYWHFDGLDSLITAALRRWENADRRTIEEFEKIKDPGRRLRGAFSEAMALDRAQSLYVTLAATSDPAVLQVLRRVSRRRMRFLNDAYSELGLEPEEAYERALLTYTAYLGVIHLRRQSFEGLRSINDVDSYVDHASRTLIPSPKRKGSGSRQRSDRRR
jgi:AcrR family transcriptional regulator